MYLELTAKLVINNTKRFNEITKIANKTNLFEIMYLKNTIAKNETII